MIRKGLLRERAQPVFLPGRPRERPAAASPEAEGVHLRCHSRASGALPDRKKTPAVTREGK